MTDSAEFASGKGHKDENFPVASWLIRAELRPAVLAFYRFARSADDIADHETATAAEKLAGLARMEAGLRGERGKSAEGEALHAVLRERGLADQHALDLLEAFRRDVVKDRYADWSDLMDYCRYSAAPVGRFVLDLHDESRSLWPQNDALCAALQVINHLQDCAKDYRLLGRVYVPLDALSAEGIGVASLVKEEHSRERRKVIAGLARQTSQLLERSRAFGHRIADRRLAFEVGAIQALAESLAVRLMHHDPLLDRVHHRRLEMIGLGLRGVFGVATGRVARKFHRKPADLRSEP
jgi:hydroxysqualene synthase